MKSLYSSSVGVCIRKVCIRCQIESSLWGFEIVFGIRSYLKLGIDFPLMRLLAGSRVIMEADRDSFFSPVSRLRWYSWVDDIKNNVLVFLINYLNWLANNFNDT